MLSYFFEKLEGERKVIKGAPRHFVSACLLVFLIFGILWYSFFRTTIGIQADTIQAYKDRYGALPTLDSKEVMLTDDISKLFVVEIVTNLVDGNKIVLKYEPVPQTVIIKMADGANIIPYIPFPSERDDLANIDGHTITIKTNGELLKHFLEERSRAITRSIDELVSQGITNYVIRPDFKEQVTETNINPVKTNYVVHIGIASVEYVRKSPR